MTDRHTSSTGPHWRTSVPGLGDKRIVMLPPQTEYLCIHLQCGGPHEDICKPGGRVGYECDCRIPQPLPLYKIPLVAPVMIIGLVEP